MKQQLMFLMGMLCLFLIGCKKSMNYDDLVLYINNPENGLVQTKESGDVKCKLTFKPASVMLYDEFGNKQDSLFIAKEKAYRRFYYFVLNLSGKNGDVLYGNENFSEKLNKFTFGLGSIAYMTTNKNDTISLADYYTPNLYGMSKSTSVLLAFEKPSKESESITIHLSDLGAGSKTFEFIRKDLDNIPQLLTEL
ncbi:MAG: hypothetical protein NVV82_19385 [Sporocytophaga sp.]|nr:hypothetical protein [Sporocytophaga sp.]